jgi:S-adenosylmethionine:tRNA ribosyltransferase-isomerase
VSPAALSGVRPARDEFGEDVAVGVNLLRRTGPDRWTAYARPGRRLREGDVVVFAGGLEARLETKTDGAEVGLRFNRAGAELDAGLAVAGATPLPPYIARRIRPSSPAWTARRPRPRRGCTSRRSCSPRSMRKGSHVRP